MGTVSDHVTAHEKLFTFSGMQGLGSVGTYFSSLFSPHDEDSVLPVRRMPKSWPTRVPVASARSVTGGVSWKAGIMIGH